MTLITDQHFGRFAAAELEEPADEPPALPLVPDELVPVVPLPLIPDELPLEPAEPLPDPLEEPEADPDAAVFSFGWPVA